MRSFENAKVALVHDWLIDIGGSDRVLKALHEIFPEAPIYVLFEDRGYSKRMLPNAKINTSGAQNFYSISRHTGFLLPFLPSAVESFDLREYDMVISCGAIFSKGLVLRPSTIHIAYCHSPARMLWDRSTEYILEKHVTRRRAVAIAQHLLRIWDGSASKRVDRFIANSEHVKQRIQKYYRRVSEVIHPPVDPPVHKLSLQDVNMRNFFLIVSRLFRHKNIDIALRAFNKLEWPLVIVGSGPDFKRLKRLAGPTIYFAGREPDERLAAYYEACTAFVMPQEEDFGIAPVEAMFFGKPILAFRKGGAMEYVIEGETGIFFDAPTEAHIANGARIMLERYGEFSPEDIKTRAKKFSKSEFKKKIKRFAATAWYESKSLHNHSPI